MRVRLAPGETLLPGAEEAIAARFADPRVVAILLPLDPAEECAFARAARRHLRAWDARFIHRQTFFAPAARVAVRDNAPAPAGPRNADAAPLLADALASGRIVEALDHPGVSARLGDLAAWVAHHRAEGSAWGALAAREPRFAPFLPAVSRAGWWRHNLAQAPRRSGEILQATRSPAPLPWALHLAAEAAFTGACVRAFRSGNAARVEGVAGPG